MKWMLKIDLRKLRFDYGKQMLLLGFASLLIAGGAYAVGYAVVDGEVVEVRDIDAPALALALGGEITALNAQADDAEARRGDILIPVKELRDAARFLGAKYPLAVNALNLLIDELEVEASLFEGEALYYREQAIEKQDELKALNDALKAQG